MMTDATKLFHAHPELAIFLAVVLGFLLGRVHVKGIGLGTVVGTLIAGLALGILFTPEIPDLLKWAFFDLFLFAIGYSTGPQFFAGLKKETLPQIGLPLGPGTIPQRGDVLHAVGSLANIERVARRSGFIDTDPSRFAPPFLALGLTVGILVGLLSFRIGAVPIGLGTSCAILLVGLTTGWARSRYPLFGGIPDSATRILQDVGLTVFIAIVGLTAGPHAVAVLHERGISYFLTVFAAGAIVTMVPQLLGFDVGAKLLKTPVPILLGGLAGAQTATPALNALKEAGGNNVFVLGFTVPYAINNVLLTLWGTVIVTVVYSWGR